MGGRIWVESEPGQGSTFWFTAHFGLSGPAQRWKPAEWEEVRGLPVLVVDDNGTNRRILDETLVQWGMRPTVVESGATALAALNRAFAAGEPFALVLLDVNMPEMDGFELVQRIQQQPALATATIMMLSSGGRPGDSARCRDLGIASFLTKPVRQSELRKAIQTALGATSMRRGQAASAAKPARSCRPLRILLAEDNRINQKLAMRLLEKQGHSVVIATNGQQAIDVSAGESFDMLLMDVQMPETDGLTAATAIRQREAATGARRTPILAMTAHAMKGDRERCLQAGMDDYISKPIRSEELYSAIQRLAAGQCIAENPPPAADPAPLRSLVDWDQALSYVGGDEDLLRELIQTFVAECPRWIADLDAGLGRDDAQAVSAAAHPFKNSLSVVGATAAAESANCLEKMGRGGELSGAAAVRQTLQRELDRLLPALATFAAKEVAESH